jgi:hypothetical protein
MANKMLIYFLKVLFRVQESGRMSCKTMNSKTQTAAAIINDIAIYSNQS